MKYLTFIISIFLTLGFSKKEDPYVPKYDAHTYDPWEHGFYTHATPEMFGWTGHDLHYDNAAVQASFDTGGTVTFDNGQTYTLTSKIDVDVSGDQIVNGNDATITTNQSNFEAFDIEKTSGRTTFNDLLYDGNLTTKIAFRINSPSTFNDITVEDLGTATDQSIVAFWMYHDDVQPDDGDYYFNNCNTSNLQGYDAATWTTNSGPSKSIWIEMLGNHAASGSTYTIDGGVFNGAWGDNGDHFLWVSHLSSSSNTSQLTIRNAEIKNYSRRALKFTGGNVLIEDVIIRSPSNTHPEINQSAPAAAMVAQGAFTGLSENAIYRRCTFDNSANPGDPNITGPRGQFAPNNMEDMLIQDCDFINTDVWPSNTIGTNVRWCGNDWDANSAMYDGYQTVYNGNFKIADNQTGNSGYNQMSAANWEVYNSCPVSNRIKRNTSIIGIW